MKFLYVTMPDKMTWAIPVRIIAESRAWHYAEVDDISFEESLNEDTLPLFEQDEYEIIDWAQNNMNWEDVKEFATLIHIPRTTEEDYQEGWCNGHKEIIDHD